jgi:hypothetical protein
VKVTRKAVVALSGVVVEDHIIDGESGKAVVSGTAVGASISLIDSSSVSFGILQSE